MRIGSDIGGTFTDIVAMGADGGLTVTKLPSTPDDFSLGLVGGIGAAVAAAGIPASAVTEVLHGCTIATNAILEHKGARTALFTTRGFRDVLELRRIRVPRLYDPLYVKPAPLVPRELRFEVTERIGADGQVVMPLSETAIEEAVAIIRDRDIEAVAVCFLHSYRNPDHERRFGEGLRKALPDIYVSLSVEVLPQMKEYERTSTTVVNSYVGPPVSRYLSRAQAKLDAAGIDAPLILMQSGGGIATADEIARVPAQIVECGPAAGVIGASKLSAACGLRDVITFDMGGTTAKVSLIENGRIFLSDTYEVGGEQSFGGVMAGGAGYALRLPVIDIAEIGAGGGSLVHVDRAGAISVGPHSAGADPGPACYGRNNMQPTVTDANVALGYIGADSLAGSGIDLDADLSREAIRREVCSRIGGTVEEAAFGIRQVANARMARAIKSVSTYKGRDPRRFVLVAYGGNGGVHGPDLAGSLEIGTVLVPPAPGVFSAVGLLCADLESSRLVPVNRPLEKFDAALMDGIVRAHRAALAASLGGRDENADLLCSALMHYEGQAYDLEVPLLPDVLAAPGGPGSLRENFGQEHLATYGHNPAREHGIEVSSVRLRLRLPSTAKIEEVLGGLGQQARELPRRQCYFGDRHGFLETRVCSRGALGSDPIAGPVIVEDTDGTTVVAPECTVRRDDLNNLVIQRG